MQIGPLHPQRTRRTRNVPLRLLDRAQNVLPLGGLPGFRQIPRAAPPRAMRILELEFEAKRDPKGLQAENVNRP